MSLPADFAVYAEHSDSMKKLEPGWNARVFNRIESEEGSNIRADVQNKTGIITLGPGVYHLTGFSSVTYNDLDPHPSGDGWPTKQRPNAGYCRLRYTKDVDCPNELAIVIGSISNANMVASMFDTYLDVPHRADLVLEHQAGFSDVAEIYLQDNSAKSSWHVFSRITIRRVLRTSSTYQRSALAKTFDAAFETFLADGQSYQHLLASYLGMEPKFVPTVDDSMWMPASDRTLARIFKSGVLRFGYADGAAPYVYRGPAPNSDLRGLDWELGNAITAIIRDHYFSATSGKGLRAEWVKMDVPTDGDPEDLKFKALHDGLQRGLFDIAMSGQANISTTLSTSDETRQVDWTAATGMLFTNILYTGRDGHDMSALVGGTRDEFIREVKNWPEVKVMCVANPGPSTTNSMALVADINAAGGKATLDKDGTLPTISAAIADQTIHFSVGDAFASAWIGNQPGFKGLNLNIAAGVQPLQTVQQVAAFTLPG